MKSVSNQTSSSPLTIPIDPLAASLEVSTMPTRLMAKNRNAALDWLFYDVSNLTNAELTQLATEINVEGSILVVWPTSAGHEMGVRKFADYESLKAEPGDLLTRFTIAGVGSSDVGAAAFARTVADRYQQPVGAIVAGYGVADLVAEALGGWFFYGAANRIMGAYQDGLALITGPSGKGTALEAGSAAETDQVGAPGSDTLALIKLLLDDDREIRSVAGHSKGCLSIALALESLALTGNKEAISRAQRMRITTAGAVVTFPTGYTNIGQYLGAIDWFGGFNSRLDLPRELIPGAWHHLNTKIATHMDFGEVLKREPD